jgi:hypothetical protein
LLELDRALTAVPIDLRLIHSKHLHRAVSQNAGLAADNWQREHADVWEGHGQESAKSGIDKGIDRPGKAGGSVNVNADERFQL